MIYAGRDDPRLNAFTPATVQMGDRPNSKKPSKVRTISDATHGNFHLHLLQQIQSALHLHMFQVAGLKTQMDAISWIYVTVYSSDGAEGFYKILK